jgi:signal-transduction protein with cAMP-binding, CBS, and nucleotidyltransferase domain
MKFPLTKGWTEQRCRDLNLAMANKFFNVGETVYSVGDSVEYMYILIKGALVMSSVVSMTDVN